MVYKIRMIYPDGETEIMDDEFDSYEDAKEMAQYYVGCYTEGGELLHMSNPGDYPISDEEAEYEIFKE